MTPRGRRRLAFCAASVALFLSSAAGRAHAGVDQWTSNGPYGGTVWAVAIDPVTPTRLYAGTPGGIFRSTDGGASWSGANSGLSTSPYSIVIDPSAPATLYAGGPAADGGVFKSTDGAASWNKTSHGLGAIFALAIDPAHPTTLYAGAWNLGLYKSTDGAANWSNVTGDMVPSGYQVDVLAVAIDPANPSTLYAGTNRGLYKSTDGAASWSNVTGGIDCPGYETYEKYVVALAIDPANPATLYAREGNCGLYKSTNGGATWTALNTGLPVAVAGIPASGLAIDPANPTTLYVGLGREGVFRSADGGATWSAVASELPGSNVNTLAMDPITPTTLYVATDGGVLKRTSDVSTLSAASTGLTNSLIYALAVDPATPTTIYAGTEGGGVFRSTDGGGSWSATNAGITHPYIHDLAIDPTTPATLYAGTTGGVFRSTDGAESWTKVGTGLPVDISWLSLAIDPVTPTTLYAGLVANEGGVYKSTDGAQSWTAASNGLLPLSSQFANYIQIQVVAVDPTNPTTLYAGTPGWARSCVGGPNYGTGCTTDTQCPESSCGMVNTGVYKSTDGAASWTLVTNVTNGFTSGLGVVSIAIDPTDSNTLYAATSGYTSPYGVFRSTDGGASWNVTDISSLCSANIYDLAIDPVTPTTLYGAASYCGVLQSTDGGLTWGAFNNGLAPGASQQAYALAISASSTGAGAPDRTLAISANSTESRASFPRAAATMPTRIHVGTQGAGFVSPSVAAVLGVFSMVRSGVGVTTTTTTSTSTSTSTTLAPLCGASPVAPGSCRLAAPLAAQVQIKDNPDDTKDQFRWAWKKGDATTLTDFKDPVNGSATYRVCVYDASANTQPLMEADLPPGGICGTKPCWKPTGTTGFGYKNKLGTPSGLTGAKLKAGIAGKAAVQMKGKGVNLPTPTLPLTLPVTVQFLAKDGAGTNCWQTTYTNRPSANDATQFKAKGP